MRALPWKVSEKGCEHWVGPLHALKFGVYVKRKVKTTIGMILLSKVTRRTTRQRYGFLELKKVGREMRSLSVPVVRSANR